MPKDKEGTATITFRNDFCSDLSLKNMLYAVTVRSPVDRGMITSISQDDSVEGCTLITARDVPGSNLVDSTEGKIKVFCDGNVSYAGEPIGLLLGPDEETVKRAMSGLHIHYDDSPIEHYIKSSGDDSDSTELFGDNDQERLIEYGDCFTMESGKRKGIDAELAEAEVLVQNDWTYSLSPKNYRETCGSLCSFNGKKLTIYSPSQWISNLRGDLAEVLHVSPNMINVTRTKDFNRSTNSIWYNSIIACQTAVASYKLKAPVKLIYSRQEQELYIDCMKPIHFHTELGANRDGRLTAMKVEVSIDSGSTNVFIGEIMDRLAIACTSCYKANNVSIRVTTHRSNTPPLSLDMQVIDSASFFAIESAISALAQKLNTDPENSLIFPSEIRKLNLNLQPEGTEDKDTRRSTMPFNFSLPKAEESIDILFDSSDFKNKYIFYNRESIARSKDFTTQFTASPFSPPIRGIGFAIGYEGSFYYGSKVYGTDQELTVTLEDYGDLTIHSPPLSLSIQEIWTKQASDILGIRPSRIKIDSNFDSGSEPFIPESAYANISIMTVLLKKCCESIKRKREKDP
ncbi:MAG: xanthine dehydrogenase family protein, partial [Treponema sp.]|nr:xanthine dehydrogenase family protein [Treponema sp.]